MGSVPNGMGSVPNGIRISLGGPSLEQADQPPNGLGASFRPGCAGCQPLENDPKTLNLMPLGTLPLYSWNLNLLPPRPRPRPRLQIKFPISLLTSV